VQYIFPEISVKAFDLPILQRLSWLSILHCYSFAFTPILEILTNKPTTIIYLDTAYLAREWYAPAFELPAWLAWYKQLLQQ
jgi:hypothetical protein